MEKFVLHTILALLLLMIVLATGGMIGSAMSMNRARKDYIEAKEDYLKGIEKTNELISQLKDVEEEL